MLLIFYNIHNGNPACRGRTEGLWRLNRLFDECSSTLALQLHLTEGGNNYKWTVSLTEQTMPTREESARERGRVLCRARYWFEICFCQPSPVSWPAQVSRVTPAQASMTDIVKAAKQTPSGAVSGIIWRNFFLLHLLVRHAYQEM